MTLAGRLFSLVAITEYQNLNVLLAKNNAYFNLQRTKQVLATFRRRHTLNTQFLLYINRNYISKCCASYFLFNFPFNVYAFVFLFFGRHPVDSFYIFILIVFLLQTCIPLKVLLTFVLVNETLSSSVPHLVTSYVKMSQGKGSPKNLLMERWKTASYLELFHPSSHPLELKAGHLGAFSRENVLQVCFNLFCIFKLKIKLIFKLVSNSVTVCLLLLLLHNLFL